MRKYEFVEGDVVVSAFGEELKRIRAVVEIPVFSVKSGDFGGYIAGNASLNHCGDAQVSPIHIQSLRWPVTICDQVMTIGCQTHSLRAWDKFSDAEIASMDYSNALHFWRKYKDVLLALARANGRKF